MDNNSESASPCANRIFAEDTTQPGATLCAKCSKSWSAGEIRIRQNDDSWHLACFEPLHNVRIRAKDVTSQLSRENEDKFAQWTTRFNEMYTTLSSAKLAKYEAVATAATVTSRELLEPFRYLSARDCALVLPLVCSQWRLHSLHDELWQSLYAAHFPRLSAASLAYRSAFISAYFLTCVGCSARFPPDTPVTSRTRKTQPICDRCCSEYCEIEVAACCKALGVTREVLKASGVQEEVRAGKSWVEPQLVKTAVVAYRAARRREACRDLRAIGTPAAAQTATYLDSLDLHAIYSFADVANALQACGSHSAQRFLHSIFLEDSKPGAHLFVPVPARRESRRQCVYPSQQPAKLRRLRELTRLDSEALGE